MVTAVQTQGNNPATTWLPNLRGLLHSVIVVADRPPARGDSRSGAHGDSGDAYPQDKQYHVPAFLHPLPPVQSDPIYGITGIRSSSASDSLVGSELPLRVGMGYHALLAGNQLWCNGRTIPSP